MIFTNHQEAGHPLALLIQGKVILHHHVPDLLHGAIRHRQFLPAEILRAQDQQAEGAAVIPAEVHPGRSAAAVLPPVHRDLQVLLREAVAIVLEEDNIYVPPYSVFIKQII